MAAALDGEMRGSTGWPTARSVPMVGSGAVISWQMGGGRCAVKCGESATLASAATVMWKPGDASIVRGTAVGGLLIAWDGIGPRPRRVDGHVGSSDTSMGDGDGAAS